ncbi:helix-turn-helix domain-containing protein [Patescibacteria group bacterium]|nr:helix-turn-helix domain-containing protein [Patescibacteria group bacterium]
MASFRQKKISRGQTLSDKLKQARISQEVSLEEMSQATKIQIKYLEILEEGDYQKLPGDIYAKAWLKLYADFLSLDISELLADYKIEKSVRDKLIKVSKPNDSKSIPNYNILKPNFLKILSIGFLVLILLGYLAWEINNIVSPPQVIISEPNNNFRTSESSVFIKGQTKPEVQLTINNETVLLDSDGNFIKEVNLVSGLNNLQINAKKKHSKINNLELIIFRDIID